MSNDFQNFLRAAKTEIREAINGFGDNFDIDDDFEKIVEWASTNKNLTIQWSDRFIDTNGNVRVVEERAAWQMVWQYGFLTFSFLKEGEESRARKCAALFIYLWANGIDVAVAIRCANSYVLHYTL